MGTHEINGMAFIIDDYSEGEWFWTCAASESDGYFKSQVEALSDAMTYASALITDYGLPVDSMAARELEDERKEYTTPSYY